MINRYPPPMSDKDYVLIDSEEMVNASLEYKEIEEKLKALEDKKKIVKKLLIDLTDGGNVICPKGGIKISTISREGAVDIKTLCEKFSISESDLAIFRKKPVVYQKIDIVA